MVVNVNAAFNSDIMENVILIRVISGTYVNGVYQKNISRQIRLNASVQKITGTVLMQLPEGERDSSSKIFYMQFSTRTTSDRDNLLADTIVYDNVNYRIVKILDWNNYEYIAAVGIRNK